MGIWCREPRLSAKSSMVDPYGIEGGGIRALCCDFNTLRSETAPASLSGNRGKCLARRRGGAEDETFPPVQPQLSSRRSLLDRDRRLNIRLNHLTSLLVHLDVDRSTGGVEAEFGEDLLLDVLGDLWVVAQELLDVVAALAHLDVSVGEEGAGLLEDVVLDAEVHEAAL